VRAAMREQLLVLTGGPGTGKTYTVKQIVEGWRRRDKRVVLACPTARAATVLAATVGSPASTIHRLLDITLKRTSTSATSYAPSRPMP